MILDGKVRCDTCHAFIGLIRADGSMPVPHADTEPCCAQSLKTATNKLYQSTSSSRTMAVQLRRELGVKE